LRLRRVFLGLFAGDMMADRATTGCTGNRVPATDEVTRDRTRRCTFHATRRACLCRHRQRYNPQRDGKNGLYLLHQVMLLSVVMDNSFVCISKSRSSHPTAIRSF
jgi:hypothetical protein